MSELVTDRIRTHAERLRLSHIAETADALIERAEASEMGYREYPPMFAVTNDLVLQKHAQVSHIRNLRQHNSQRIGEFPGIIERVAGIRLSAQQLFELFLYVISDCAAVTINLRNRLGGWARSMSH